MLENAAIEFSQSVAYVIGAPFFWQAMASVTIVAMILGTLVYNGDLDKLHRATIAIVSYGAMIMSTTMTRIFSTTNFVFEHMKNGQIFAGVTTILLVTVFYLIGLYLGYTAHKLSKK